MTIKWNFVFLLYYTIALLVVRGEREMCEPALQHLVKHGIAQPDLARELPSANGSSVCGGGNCCVPRLTEAMLSRGRYLLQLKVQENLSKFSEKLTTARDNFGVAVEDSLRSSEKRTLDMLESSYPNLLTRAKVPLRKLFHEFQSSIGNVEDEDHIDRALDTFWNDLFPMVFQTQIHSRLPQLSPAYEDCLRELRSKIDPWRVFPEPIGQTLIRGLEATRLMLHVVSEGVRVVRTASDYEIPEECGEPSARLYFCSACHGVTAVPCSGLCSNVARGCLAPMAEVDNPWSTLIFTAEELGRQIKFTGIASLLKDFPEKLSDVIMVVMESGTKLEKTVRNKCGQYAHTTSESHHTRTEEEEEIKRVHPFEPGAALLDPNTVNVQFELQATEIVNTLHNSAGYWASVADSVCVSPAPQDRNCWNGRRLAEYSRPTADLAVHSQKYNPEVQVTKYDPRMYAFPEDLRKIKELVSRRLTWAGDTRIRKNQELSEGSGLFPERHPDDEGGDDGYEGSGYDNGSGDQPRMAPIPPVDEPFSIMKEENSSNLRGHLWHIHTMIISCTFLFIYFRITL